MARAKEQAKELKLAKHLLDDAEAAAKDADAKLREAVQNVQMMCAAECSRNKRT